eukprot:CAMPEP_0113637670 /NCGR_PEP_ID=MMETSP0017_2-20120614/19728_1 /TAXON_ID=2856 /ORGANISM="Cylindrotheca closterium" /LENGTH=113 /DNA_ID=CAMNT_0000548729 /DNA_START=423 /DNA_END=764 /DNA_ORIENTATION=+ /assembly_acc=CAM_ASM_000147
MESLSVLANTDSTNRASAVNATKVDEEEIDKSAEDDDPLEKKDAIRQDVLREVQYMVPTHVEYACHICCHDPNNNNNNNESYSKYSRRGSERSPRLVLWQKLPGMGRKVSSLI